MMTNRLDQFPLLQAIQGIQMEQSYSLVSNAVPHSSNASMSMTSGDILNSQKSNQINNNPMFKIEQPSPQIYNATKPSLREHVFISKDTTKRLSEYIVNEDWSNKNEYGLLYKYLDYIFRCQLFKKQVIQINAKHSYLIFHTGLQRRTDSEFLYALLIPNKKYVQQKWRVGFGNIKHSFLSKKEILYKLRYLLCPNYLLSQILPKRTKFHQSLDEFLFDDSYQIEVNWEERIITNKDRICQVLGVQQFTQKWKIRQLMNLFDRALEKTKKTLALNPRLAVAQGFVDTKHCTYRMELLLPLNIEYPKFSNQFFTFALAIGKSTDQTETYTAKSVLTTEMAYNNARLVSYVDSSWLLPPKNKESQQVPHIASSYDSHSLYSADNDYILC